jgi:hypothetical protein
MVQFFSATFDRSEITPLPAQGKNDKAQIHHGLLGASSSFNRQAQLSSLLARIRVDGAQTHEQEIDRLRAIDDLSDIEREIVREIFCLGFNAAEKEQRQDKIQVYRWLLARLVLNHTLDQPIPLNERSPEISREVTAHVAEPSVTQQSPKHGDSARRVSTASIPHRVVLYRYALCSIGVATLIWTTFAFRSPTPAVIEPVAEGPSASMAEPAPMSDAIVDDVATSSKSPATAKLDTPAQPGKSKSPANVTSQPTTVDAARGENREREPARDSLPIYQTRRRILLREEPRFGAPSAIMLDTGARLIVLEINGPWLKVKMENTGSPGFVRVEFVVPTGAAAPPGAGKDQSPP